MNTDTHKKSLEFSERKIGEMEEKWKNRLMSDSLNRKK